MQSLDRLIAVVEANTRTARTNEKNVNAVLNYMGRLEEHLTDLQQGFSRVAASFLLADDEIAKMFPLTSRQEVLGWSARDPQLLKFRAR